MEFLFHSGIRLEWRTSKKAVKPHDMNFQQTPRERSSTFAAIRNPPRFQRLPIVPIFAFETRPTH